MHLNGYIYLWGGAPAPPKPPHLRGGGSAPPQPPFKSASSAHLLILHWDSYSTKNKWGGQRPT